MMISTRLLRAAAVTAAVWVPAANGAAQSVVTAGNVLVANQQSASATIVDVATREATTLDVGAGPHETVVSPDGKWGVVTIYGTPTPGNQLAVIDMAAKKVVRTIDLGEYIRPHGASFVPGAPTQVVVTSERTENVVLVDIAQGKVITAMGTKHPGTHMLGVTRDGKRAFAASITWGGIVELDLEKREFVRDLQVSTQTEGVAVAPDGGTVWVGSNNGHTVSVVDTKSWSVVAKIEGLGMPYRIGISPDGKTAVFCDAGQNKIWIADVATRKLTGEVGPLDSPRGVKIAPDNRTVYVTLAGTANAVTAIDLVDRKVKWTAPVGTAPDGVWYGPKP